MKIDKEFLIEHKQKIMGILSFLIIAVSLFAIGYVVYKFFFWAPPIPPEPFKINLSNFNLTG